jgi:8-oxo-dGTP pyrophosphatase MutT (NUDIX family)
MAQTLAAFLDRFPPQARSTAVWGDGQIVLTVTSYLGEVTPPLAFLTSVRAIVIDSAAPRVLVVRDLTSQHIVPGGRREPGETLDETLRREVLEETGWTVRDPWPLGFVHFHHETPPPADFLGAPYPDFVQQIYLTRADRWESAAIRGDGPELGADFQPLATVQTLSLQTGERIFLAAATRLAVERQWWQAEWCA